jgi:hypothetical protein
MPSYIAQGEETTGSFLGDSIRGITPNWKSEPSTVGNILANIPFKEMKTSL